MVSLTFRTISWLNPFVLADSISKETLAVVSFLLITYWRPGNIHRQWEPSSWSIHFDKWWTFTPFKRNHSDGPRKSICSNWEEIIREQFDRFIPLAISTISRSHDYKPQNYWKFDWNHHRDRSKLGIRLHFGAIFITSKIIFQVSEDREKLVIKHPPLSTSYIFSQIEGR